MGFIAHEVQGGTVNNIFSHSTCARHFEENCIKNYLKKVPIHILLCNAKLQHIIYKVGDMRDITILIVFVVPRSWIQSSELGSRLSGISCII